MENDFRHTRFNSLAKNVIENGAFRWKKSKQQREVNIDTGKETDSHKNLLTKPTEQVVDFSLIYSDLLVDESRSSKMDTSTPNLCTNSAHISNDSSSTNGERNKPLFCTQDKEILIYLRRTRAGTKYNYNGQRSKIRLFLFWYCFWFKQKKSSQIWKLKFSKLS